MALDNITVPFVNTYGTSVLELARQKGSKLRSLIREEAVSGETHFFEVYGATGDMREITSRGGAIIPSDTAFERRAVSLRDFYDDKLIYDYDKVRMLVDPTSAIVAEQADMVGRTLDQMIITAFNANMRTGRDGTTLTAGQTAIAKNSWKYGVGSGNAGLTISKLQEAKQLMDVAYVSMENRFIACDSVNYALLCSTVEANSSEYVRSGQAMETGILPNMKGFTIVMHPLLDLLANRYDSTTSYAYAFQGGDRGGMALAVGSQPKFDLSQRKDIEGHPYQAYVGMTAAATRLENAKVVPILCSYS